jgi:hypothetical protein
MRRPVLCLAVVVMITTGACEHGNGGSAMSVPSGPSRKTYAVDPTYRMSADDRDKVMEIFDINALERLISMLAPEDRREILAHFQHPDGDMVDPLPKLVQLGDPDLQAVLEEVWVPYWYTVPPEARYAASGIPGRQLALNRMQSGQ